jgi:hypothetical protein
VDVHRVHALGRAGQHHREVVHGEAGIDAGADDSDAGGFGCTVELGGGVTCLHPWVGELLAGGDDVGTALDGGEELGQTACEGRGRGVRDDDAAR